MKKKLFLISSVLFFASSILFAQYDFSIKAYTIFGNIQTKHIDKYHIGRFKFKRDFENINNSNFEAPKLVSDGLNYGLELTYNILSNLSLGVGYERSGNSSNSFDYSSGDQGFPPRPQFWIAEKLIFDFQSIPINIFCKISVIKNFSAYANAGIQLNFGDFSHSKSFYYYTKSNAFKEEYFKGNSETIGYHLSVGVELDLISRFSIFLSGNYTQKKFDKWKYNETNEVIKLAGSYGSEEFYHLRESYPYSKNETDFKFNASSFYISAGLKIGIL